MAAGIFSILSNENPSLEPIHRIYDGDPIPTEARTSRRLANIESDLSKTFDSEVIGVIMMAYKTTADIPPKTSVNQTLKKLINIPVFYEYEIVDKNSPVRFSSISNSSPLDKLKSLSGCTKICSSAIDGPIQQGAVVRVKFAANNSREGRIVEILDPAPIILENLKDSYTFPDGSSTANGARPSNADFVRKICDDKSKYVAEHNPSNKPIEQVEQKEQPGLRFFSTINCENASQNWDPRPEGSAEQKFSKYFTLADLTVSGELAKRFNIKNIPTEEHKNNLKILATTVLDPMVEIFKDLQAPGMREGINFTINSAYRNATLDVLAGSRNDFALGKEDLITQAKINTFNKISTAPGVIGHAGGTAVDVSFSISKLGIEGFLDCFERIYKSKDKIAWNYLLVESVGKGSVWIHIECKVPQAESKHWRSPAMWGPFTYNPKLDRNEYYAYKRSVVIAGFQGIEVEPYGDKNNFRGSIP